MALAPSSRALGQIRVGLANPLIPAVSSIASGRDTATSEQGTGEIKVKKQVSVVAEICFKRAIQHDILLLLKMKLSCGYIQRHMATLL